MFILKVASFLAALLIGVLELFTHNRKLNKWIVLCLFVAFITSAVADKMQIEKQQCEAAADKRQYLKLLSHVDSSLRASTKVINVMEEDKRRQLKYDKIRLRNTLAKINIEYNNLAYKMSKENPDKATWPIITKGISSRIGDLLMSELNNTAIKKLPVVDSIWSSGIDIVSGMNYEFSMYTFNSEDAFNTATSKLTFLRNLNDEFRKNP